MYSNLDCIALRTVKYSDRNSILSVFTRQEGRLSFLIPAGKGKEASRMRALLMPLGRFECVADIRPGRDIHSIRDVRPHGLPPVGDPMRSSIAMFITDLLSSILKETMPDPLLFQYIDRAIDNLNDPKLRGAANFHIAFMIHLTRFLGIEPDWGSFRDGSVFDLTEGIFRQSPPAHRDFLPSAESEVLRALGRISFENMHRFRFNRFERNRVLDLIILYYQRHYPSIAAPTSLQILRMLGD